MVFPELFGPVGLFSNYFLGPDMLLWSLAFIVPLILLYLIRPKPQNVAVPSLMFILRDMGKSNMHRMFRTILKDILFLIQFLAVLFLALALAKPFIEVSQESLVQDSIIVLDASASMAVGDRMDDAKAIAKDSLSQRNTIILSHANPRVLDENGEQRMNAGDAKDIIDDIEETDILGDLPTALDLAAQYAGQDSKVTIISDLVLSQLENQDLIESRIKLLRSKGALVDTLHVGEPAENIGIIDARIDQDNGLLELKIQNFNEGPEEFTLEINGERLQVEDNILEPRSRRGSLLSVSVPLGNGRNTITLEPNDALMTDNAYHVSIPDKQSISVLMITNDEQAKQSRIIPALEAAGDKFTDTAITYAEPPKVPSLEHDVYVVKDVESQFILPGVINGLRDEVERGKVLVVLAQEGLFQMDWQDILPVRGIPEGQLGGRQELVVNDSLALMRGLSDIGQVDGNLLLRVEPTDGSIVYASVSTNTGREPVIAAKRIGQGAVVYYGIEDRPQFDIDPQSYAIIWGRIIDFSLQDPLDLNIQTGTVIRSAGNVRTPSGTRSSPVLVEKQGFYSLQDRVLAANLYSLQQAATTRNDLSVRVESDISRFENLSDTGTEGGRAEEGVEVPKDLSTIFIIIGLCILLFELVFIKYRGDL